MPSPQVDPRTIITPEAFAIAPDLIGLPLARPSRRLFAILLDLIPVAIITQAGTGVFLGGLAVAFVWRITTPLGKRRAAGCLIRGVAALIAFAWVTSLVGDVGNWIRRFGSAVEAVANDDPDAAAIATEALQSVPSQLRTPELEALVARATGDTGIDTAAVPANADSVVIAYAAALQRGDSATVRRLQDAAGLAVDAPRIERLRAEREEFRQGLNLMTAENDKLKGENDDLQKKLDKPRSIRTFIAGLADDLGLGFGWGALYFTAFLVLGHGQTPGKRAMGIRVIRLDGKPIGWWYAFERFGSYFASFTTGLVGFAQILWDRNRQALHDKVVETVVIRDRHAPPLHVRD